MGGYCIGHGCGRLTTDRRLEWCLSCFAHQFSRAVQELVNEMMIG